jgi:hypothetical protein
LPPRPSALNRVPGEGREDVMRRAFATSRIVKRLVRRTHILENEHDGCVVSLLAQEACYGIEEAKPHRFCIGRYGAQHIREHLAEIRDYLSKFRAPPPYSGTSITTRWPRWDRSGRRRPAWLVLRSDQPSQWRGLRGVSRRRRAGSSAQASSRIAVVRGFGCRHRRSGSEYPARPGRRRRLLVILFRCHSVARRWEPRWK